jgi:formamidopyrimidine-DNA glycosylase
MPELPEVETTLKALRPLLLANRFLKVEILRPDMVTDPAKVRRLIKGLRVIEVKRHGKYLFINLEKKLTLILHLRMSGRLAIRRVSEPELRHERIRFHLEKGLILVFNDPRTLGRISLYPTDSLCKHPSLKKLGPDAISVSEKDFLKRLSNRKGILKAVLLNQSFVAGIGNIYTDEACFKSGLDPRRKIGGLSISERRRFYRAIIATLRKGIRNMGTSISDFLGLHGKPGKNQNSLWVYGRKGKLCRRCKTTLKSTRIQQRTTVWCPKCQRKEP